jgi:hypothetical protein
MAFIAKDAASWLDSTEKTGDEMADIADLFSGFIKLIYMSTAGLTATFKIMAGALAGIAAMILAIPALFGSAAATAAAQSLLESAAEFGDSALDDIDKATAKANALDDLIEKMRKNAAKPIINIPKNLYADIAAGIESLVSGIEVTLTFKPLKSSDMVDFLQSDIRRDEQLHRAGCVQPRQRAGRREGKPGSRPAHRGDPARDRGRQRAHRQEHRRHLHPTATATRLLARPGRSTNIDCDSIMAITGVIEQSPRTGSIDHIRRDYSRQFLVYTDDPADDAPTVLASTLLPRPGDYPPERSAQRRAVAGRAAEGRQRGNLLERHRPV